MDFAFCYFEREIEPSATAGLVNRAIDRKIAQHLVLSVRRHHPNARITQLTNVTTPALASDIEILRLRLPEEKPMIARMLLYAAYKHSLLPTVFVDADMVLCKPFDISNIAFTDRTVLLCERFFVRGRIVHLKVPRVDLVFDEYKDMNIEDIMPFLGCFAVTTNSQFWLHGLSLMISMDSRNQMWNGDQIALKALYDSSCYDVRVVSEADVAVPFKIFQQEPTHHLPPFVHFKGNTKYSEAALSLLK